MRITIPMCVSHDQSRDQWKPCQELTHLLMTDRKSVIASSRVKSKCQEIMICISVTGVFHYTCLIIMAISENSILSHCNVVGMIATVRLGII